MARVRETVRRKVAAALEVDETTIACYEPDALQIISNDHNNVVIVNININGMEHGQVESLVAALRGIQEKPGGN